MEDAKRYWSKGLEDVPAYVPGEQPQGEGWIKLNTNENPYGPSPKALEAAREAMGDRLRLYPEPSGRIVREAVAQVHDVEARDVFTGNGSDEILAFAFRAFFDQGSPILFPDVTYSFYPIWARAFSLPFRTIPLREDFSMEPDDYQGESGGIIFPNPNAPTARALERGSVERILSRNPARLVLVDEAYIDFGGRTAIPLTKRFPNLLVVHTLSKSRSLAGLRAAFAVGSPGLVPALERVRDWYNSYTLDSIAQAAAAAAIRDVGWTEEISRKIQSTRERFAAELSLQGWSVVPSCANFVFAAHPRLSSKDLQASLRERQILVRAFSGPRLERHVRISIGTDAEMDAVARVVRSL
ncbi:MAG TPA: histidinol-phosphate transaminase [Fibrobacteria bacterium]|nr:histidinol-phosphate transaminase [Fibrobacteria bacterium]